MSLEGRYRLLLAAFPSAHRDRYQEEMLGTLMEAASPRQSFPRPREIFDLLWNALHFHLRRRDLPRVTDPRWADAGAVFGLLGAVLVAARYVDEQTATLIVTMRHDRLDGPLSSHLSWKTFAVAGVWLVIALLALVAWRRAAAVLAWLMTLAHAGWLFYVYPSNPPLLPQGWPLMVLAVITAACLTLRVPDRRAAAHLGKTRTALAFLAIAMMGLLPSIVAVQLVRLPHDGGYIMVDLSGNLSDVPGNPSVAWVLVSAAFAAAMLVVLAKVGRLIRRRLYVLTVPALLITEVVVNYFEGFAYSSMRFWPTPVMLNPAQWLVLCLLPLLAWAIGVLLVRRNEMLE